MSRWLRVPLRGVIWTVLVICAALDGAIGSYMISRGCMIYYVNDQELVPRPQPPSLGDWAFVGGLLLFQALLVLADIRLRRPKRFPVSILPRGEGPSG
jgi:hypothetical protein